MHKIRLHNEANPANLQAAPFSNGNNSLTPLIFSPILFQPMKAPLSTAPDAVKTFNVDHRTLKARWPFAALALAISALFCNHASAQIQQAWVTHYNNGITNGSHQVLKMLLDASGNVYTCGFSQNRSGGTGYVTLKYTVSGIQLWIARLDSTNIADAAPASFAVDLSNNVVVTGNAGTVKYADQGNQLWEAPYAGLSVFQDTNCNVIVTGFGTNFNTVKLTPNGSNVWLSTFMDVGAAVSQVVLGDAKGSIYVSGSDISFVSSGYHAVDLITRKYDSDGTPLCMWRSQVAMQQSVHVKGAAFDSDGNFCVASQFNFPNQYYVVNISGDCAQRWSAFNPDSSVGLDTGYALAAGPAGDIFITGQFVNSTNYVISYGTYKLDNNGLWAWTNLFPLVASSPSAATFLVVDQADNVYVTGYSPDASGTNDIVTIAYDTNGKQLWLQRYSGLGYGAVGNAIAVDNNGNVYVAGYENVAGGGTEMVLIKYAPVTLQHQSNGNFLLQAQGAAGEPFDIRATTNLQTWLDLGPHNADTNGLLQYLDTNAALFPWRFYLAIPQ